MSSDLVCREDDNAVAIMVSRTVWRFVGIGGVGGVVGFWVVVEVVGVGRILTMPIPWWLAAGSEGSGNLSISLASEESIVSFGSGSYDASEASGCALASNVSKYWLGSFASGEH